MGNTSEEKLHDRIFISYKRADLTKVSQIKERIESELHVSCWFDLDGIESRQQFRSKICSAIDRATVFLFMYSKSHLNIDFERDWTIKELDYAQAKEKIVVLVNIDNTPLDNLFLLDFGSKNNIDANDETQMKKLIRELKSWLGIDEIAVNNSSSSVQANQLEEYRLMIEELNRKYSELATKIGSTNQTSPSQHQAQPQGDLSFTVNGVSFEMVYVEGGTFDMGATSEQGGDAESDEKPVHSVTLDGYYIGKYEVTQELWKAVMGSNASYFSGKNNPVESVSWNACQEFISRLNSLTGRTFRLPTEAEWEYAARGGNQSRHYKYSGSNNIGDVAWYCDNSGSGTPPVGTKSPNELGIYDMSGNVWEWCSDWYGSYSSGAQTNPQEPSSGSLRVLRGGSWLSSARDCRVSLRHGSGPGNSYNGHGLRLALVP